VSVALLLITHEDVGEKLVAVSDKILGLQPLSTTCMNVGYECSVKTEIKRGQALYQDLNEGDGVLIMTDIYGSTPCNIAAELEKHDDVIVVAGLNLPMLVRVYNYPKLSLKELADKAVSGGHNGIFLSSEANLDLGGK